MSSTAAESTPLPPPPETWRAELNGADEGWSRRKFIFILVLAFTIHVALVFIVGTKKQIHTRPVGAVPHLKLVDGANELVALGDPTLFARPNAHDFVSAFWRQMSPVRQPDFDWPEPPSYLAAPSGNFGSAFHEFVDRSRPAEFPLSFKPEPNGIEPEANLETPVPPATSMQFSDELARRQLLHADALASFACNDVLKPSTVQALVDTDGNVASAVVLGSSGDNRADQNALQLVRNLRFAPAPRLAFGEITFLWHTVPTNTVPATVP